MALVNFGPKPRAIEHRRKLKKIVAQLKPWPPPALKKVLEELEPRVRLFNEKIEKIRLKTMSKAERQREEAEKEERQLWVDVAQSIRTPRSPSFYDVLRFFGPRVLAEPEVQAELHELWMDALDDVGARALLQKICPPLAALDTGRPELATEEERRQNKRKSDLQSIQTTRSLRYSELALKRFHTKIESLKARQSLSIATARAAAKNIADEEFSRTTPAMEGARRLFWQQVNQEWPEL